MINASDSIERNGLDFSNNLDMPVGLEVASKSLVLVLRPPVKIHEF